MEPITYKKGDIVDFIGTRHYTKPNNLVYFSAKPGTAKVLSVIPSATHPIYLSAESNGGSTVEGWVNADTIKRIHEEPKKLEVVSCAKSKIVKIATAQDTDNGIEIITKPWKDENWTICYRPKNPKDAEKLAHMAEVGATKKKFSGVHVEPSTFAEICIYAAGFDFDDVNDKILIQSGLFYPLKTDYYLKQFRYLRRGDILFGSHNSAIVLSNGPASAEQKPIINK